MEGHAVEAHKQNVLDAVHRHTPHRKRFLKAPRQPLVDAATTQMFVFGCDMRTSYVRIPTFMRKKFILLASKRKNVFIDSLYVFWGVDNESGISLRRSASDIWSFPDFFWFLIENDNMGPWGIGGFRGWGGGLERAIWWKRMVKISQKSGKNRKIRNFFFDWKLSTLHRKGHQTPLKLRNRPKTLKNWWSRKKSKIV